MEACFVSSYYRLINIYLFKQHELTVLRSIIQNGFQWTKIKAWQGLIPSRGFREESVPLPFPGAAAHPPPLLVSSPASSAVFSVCFHTYTSFSDPSASLLHPLRTPLITLGSPRCHRIKSLTSSHLQNPPLPCQVICPLVPGIRTWTCLGPLFCLP